MLQNLTYFLVFGKPLIMYLGILTFLSLVTTATLGVLVLHGKVQFKYHLAFAIATISLGVIHGTLGMLAYF